MSRKRRTIAVVTGTRAEFGLLTPVLRAIDARRTLELKLVVTGTHLTTGTRGDIEQNGFRIDADIPMQRGGEAGRATDVAALGRGIAGMGEAFAAIQPDVVLILGDRIEALAAAMAASVGGFRLAHVHGGDRAEGVADEAMRHAISKMAHLHFAATKSSRDRLILMGERKDHTWNVGSPAADGLENIVPEQGAHPYVLVMQHPIGASPKQEGAWMRQTERALHRLHTEEHGPSYLFFQPNHDPGHEGIRDAIAPHGPLGHVPRPEFLVLLRTARAIVGNSSAGLIEAAVLKVPCVNIGPRQAGREKPANVIDCDYGEESVRKALRKALKLDLRRMRHPYGDGRSGEKIAKLLTEVNLSAVPLRKLNTY